MGGRGQAHFACGDTLAERDDPPNPPVRTGLIHMMNRATHLQVHARPGWHPCVETGFESPARRYVLVSRKLHTQTTPHRVRIAGICGACRGVLKSKHSAPNSLNNCRPRPVSTPAPDFPPAPRGHCARHTAQTVCQRLYSASSALRELARVK